MDKKLWTQFTKRITIAASSDEIYQAVTTSEGLQKWFLSFAAFTTADNRLREEKECFNANDSYQFKWYGHPEYVAKGRILFVNDKDEIEFSFTGNSTVSIRIISQDNICIVELTQRDMEWDEDPARNLLVGCGEGWVFYLTNLKSMLEGGIDLRNKNDMIRNVLNS